MKLLYFILSFLILAIPVYAQCEARIMAFDFNPKRVEAGSPVLVTALIEIKIPPRETCTFLVEAGIKPQDLPYTLTFLEVPSQPLQCCPGNDNYRAMLYEYWCGDLIYHCVEKINVSLSPLAPAPGFCDHCGGMYNNTNPNCEENPDLYWAGEGWYNGILGVYKGCYYELVAEGIPQEVYATSRFSIYVYPPAPPVPPPPPKPLCQIQVLGLPLTICDLVLLVIIGLVIAVVIHVYMRR